MYVASTLGIQKLAWFNSSTVAAQHSQMHLVYKNTEATVQAVDFIRFFSAENSVNVFKLTIHAT
jgi:hypothetical protein